MNHYGVAREAAAFYRIDLNPIPTSAAKGAHSGSSGGTAEAVPFPSVPDSPLKGSFKQSFSAANASTSAAENAALKRRSNQKHSSADFEISIEDAEGCARYTAQIVRSVKIKSSPENIASRLALVDQRAINNAADASNYTLWEMGHPTHAFDLDLLEGGKIVIRKARASETLKTLDGIDRKLSPEDLIIADAKKPVALAGVMGGFDTMITDMTRNVLIESAWFDPVAVRKTAKRHGLHTDASHRFERGADYGATTLACALVAKRIVVSGGGELDGMAIDAVAREIDQAPIVLRESQVRRILGSGIETHEMTAILKRLGFDLVPEPGNDKQFSVSIPAWRLDVEREIDVIEEVARLHGYNKFANTLPAFAGAVIEDPKAAKITKMRFSLLALGYNEAVSLSFISHADAEAFSSSPVIELANPLSEEASLMRTSLVPGMLDMLAYNLNRSEDCVRLFEMGDMYQVTNSGTAEHARVCFAATASALLRDLPQGQILDKSKSDTELDLFREFKGDVETLLKAFEYRSLTFDEQVPDYYQPGRSVRAVLDGEAVAYFGPPHSEIAAERKLRQEIYIAEIFADWLLERSLREIRYRPLPKFPGAERDFSFVFDDRITFDKILSAVEALDLAELREFKPVEILRGGAVPKGSYSILLRARFQSLERTLREDEVAEWSARMVASVTELGGARRA
jgi:phenylalanyl-tRNA synthetase beta chain